MAINSGEVAETVTSGDAGLTGTQTATRAIHLLRIIARNNPVGITLTNLAIAN